MSANLRDYQEKAIKLIGAEVQNGSRAVCLVLSTGGGKSRIQAELIKRHLNKVPGAKALITAHRTELIDQLYDTFTSQGLECGVIAAGSSRIINPHRPVQVASIQTLLARGSIVEGVTLKIDDENHHMCSEKWSPISLEYKRRGALVVGFTATPMRADGIGLGEVYDSMVCPISMRELIAQGYLVPFEMIAPAGKLHTGTIAQRPVDAYLAHAPGQKCAVFSGNIKAAEEHCAQFLEAGIKAAIVTGVMDAGLRKQTLDRYRSGELRVLINVGILTEGWDDPPTSCVILARAIGSLSLYLQIVGRALRPSPGKTRATILDLHGSSHDFGAPDDDRDYHLDGDAIRSKTGPNPFRHCLGCGVTLEGGATVCDLCGITKPELVAPDVVNAKLVKFAAKRREGNTDRAKTLARWMMDAEAKGHKIGAAFYKYQAVYNEKPSSDILELVREIRRSA